MSDIQVGEDQDPPEVGQWWVNEHGKRMHIAGKTADGTFVLEFPSGGVYRDHGNWMKCRQLEGCDSWDWLDDEWVELVDPEHILRRCVDEYFDDSVGINDWAPILASHGKPIKECQSLRKFRCRLKDLPQLPPAPTKIPVRLWVSERITYEPGSDWPVRCGENPPSGQGSWVEIHPSPDGFFVNKQS